MNYFNLKRRANTQPWASLENGTISSTKAWTGTTTVWGSLYTMPSAGSSSEVVLYNREMWWTSAGSVS